MDELFKELAKYGPIGVMCGMLVAGIVVLWKRVVSMQIEVLDLAKEAVAAMRDNTAALSRLNNEEKK